MGTTKSTEQLLLTTQNLRSAILRDSKCSANCKELTYAKLFWNYLLLSYSLIGCQQIKFKNRKKLNFKRKGKYWPTFVLRTKKVDQLILKLACRYIDRRRKLREISGRRGGELLYKVNTIIQLGNNLRFQAKLYPHLAPMQEIMRSDPSITYHLTSHQ